MLCLFMEILHTFEAQHAWGYAIEKYNMHMGHSILVDSWCHRFEQDNFYSVLYKQ